MTMGTREPGFPRALTGKLNRSGAACGQDANLPAWLGDGEVTKHSRNYERGEAAMNEYNLLSILIGAAIVLTTALTITAILSGGGWIGYIFGLLVMVLVACFAALIVMARVLLRTINMRVILECGCVAETDTTEGGHCPVHGPQRIAAYDPSIFRERLSPARSAPGHRAQRGR